MSKEDVWSHVEEWHKRGVDFQVTVKRWSISESCVNPREGCQIWNVYAYIYPNHRLWDSFEGPDMFQPAAEALPLHCGPTFLEYNIGQDGKVESLQAGSDYRRLGKEGFFPGKTRELAWEVFRAGDE